MKSLKFGLLLIVFVLSAFILSCAEFKEAGRTIGHTASNTVKVIGHGVGDAAKSVGKGTKKVVRSISEDEK